MRRLNLPRFRLLIGFMVFCSGCLFWHSSFATGNNAKPSVTLTFGIVPQQSATKLAKLWTPILNYLGKKTGYRLRFRTAKNIPAFEEALAGGEYDMAYMNPYHYVVFHESPGYQVFARQKLKHLKGIIVVRKDSPWQNLGQLGARTLAFPSPAAFAASILPRAELTKQGVDFSARYVKSHDSVYRSVAKGIYPAGGGVPRTFNNVAPEIREQLRVVWTSKGYTSHAIAAHPRVPEEVVHKVLEALITMHQDLRGKELLAAIKFKGLNTARNEEYDDIRSLGLNELMRK